MPDVTRSDSQRSDASLRPRVSFNRDVHVKRIVPREGSRVSGALSGDGAGHLVAAPVRKERLSRSKKELAEEAAKVLHQVDTLDCVTADHGVPPEKFYTLPARRKKSISNSSYDQSSLDRKSKRRKSEELITTPPKKPPRTFEASPKKSSVFGLFKKSPPKRPNLKRSVSDASNLKSKAFGPADDGYRSEREDALLKNHKKQLSPIIEVNQREDYFAPKEDEENKENIEANEQKDKKESVTEKLKEYIDEVDTALFEETGLRVKRESDEEKQPEVVVIDVDNAKDISGKKKSKRKLSLREKFRSFTSKNKHKVEKRPPKPKLERQDKVESNDPINEVETEKTKADERRELEAIIRTPSPKVKKVIDTFEAQNKTTPEMIHSSQKPVDKLPLTRGRTVDRMVKRLSNGESSSPPPAKTNILVTPSVGMAHNNNQPFSYTRGLSPDEKTFDEPKPPGSPIIYAQVVCGGNQNKQTVHTAYMNGKKHLPHSDSDEGLGYEENMGFNKGYEGERRGYEVDSFEEEFPITPKFKTNGYREYDKKYSEFKKSESSFLVDSAYRGRGDGMDSKRRDSFNESFDNGFATPVKLNNTTTTPLNGRSDLSARRDLLESRINRRIGETYLRTSPEYTPKENTTNIYISESSSKYYRGGSKSPAGFHETYLSETKIDDGEKYHTESHEKRYFGQTDDYPPYYDNEPKSFDSQISDYRSSPENRRDYKSRPEKQQIFKNREYYKSNPEIYHKAYEDRERNYESYHDSLRRERYENRSGSSKYQNECDRKEKFVDSGIENDFRRDSGETYRTSRQTNRSREYCNDSEDEGFASSLLIASERQHTEDNFNTRKTKNDYDSDRSYHNRHDNDDSYRNLERMDYREKHDYAHRERSIDDGSHYDPRIDKNYEPRLDKTLVRERGTLKKLDKKPPKPEKKSGLERMKQFFSRDSSKKANKKGMVKEETLRARYTEYKGSRENLDAPIYKKHANDLHASYDYNKNRRRLSTPSPSPTREIQRNGKTENTHGSWFKSLDRLSRKKSKKSDREDNLTSTEDETHHPKHHPAKNLRFFGDTDIESNDSLRQKPSSRARNGFTNDRLRSQSTRELHNICEERRTPDLGTQRRNGGHKSMLNISEVAREGTLKPPISPSHHHRSRDVPSRSSREERLRRRKNEMSSVESSEGDSSQQSQRSVVYLHAATVGDIPGPTYLRNGRRAASREELASNSSSRIQPQVKTLSRSFSVLAPWRPRHSREGMDIDYMQYPTKQQQQQQKNGKYEQKVTRNGTSNRKESSSTLKKKAQENMRKSNQMLNGSSRSKENLSTLKRCKEENGKGSNSTLYKKRENVSKENRYNRDRDEMRKMSSKSMSVEHLGTEKKHQQQRDPREISRSVSMPRDPEKSAGWFKTSKKTSKKSGSTQRL